MNQTDYAYSVAYVRAIENKLLSKSDVESLITAPTPKDAIMILLDKGYGNEMVEPENYSSLLSHSFEESFSEIRDVAPKGAPLDVIICKNDFHNLKVIIKGITSGYKDFEKLFLYPVLTDTEFMKNSIAGGTFENYPPHLKDVAIKAYELYSRTGDSQLADTVIDKATMDYSMSLAKESHNKFIIDYVRLTNTLTDIKIAMRCAITEKDGEFGNLALSAESGISRDGLLKAMLQGPGGVLEYLSKVGFDEESNALSKSIDEYEKFSDNKITDFLKNSRYISLGVEPLVAYLHTKQIEIQTVRIIMSAKLIGADADQIRKRLREFV